MSALKTMSLLVFLVLFILTFNVVSPTLDRSKRQATAAKKLGPAFHIEPPSRFTFSNSSGSLFLINELLWLSTCTPFQLPGGILDCSAHGIPSPRISWLWVKNHQSQNVVTNQDLVQVLPHNNSLKFRPFTPSDFDSKIHSATFQCKAESESGTTLSRKVKVEAGKNHIIVASVAKIKCAAPSQCTAT